MSKPRAFTLIELLVVIAIIAVLAGILFPVLTQARKSGQGAVCLSHLKQWGIAFQMYLDDANDRMPDRRDLKAIGYRPWTSWPPSDPRVAWMLPLLQASHVERLTCPVVAQWPSTWVQAKTPTATYWAWRFDRTDDPIPLDNWWGKSPDQALADARDSGNPTIGTPEGVSELELLVDPYFPKTIASVLPEQKGATPHIGRRIRLFLDLHARSLADARTDR